MRSNKRLPEQETSGVRETSLSPEERRLVFTSTFLLVVLSWSSLKIVLPALPGFTDVFSCSEHAIKLSVSLYLLFFALSQPIWGAVSQKKGIDRTLVTSFVIVIAGSALAMLSGSLALYMSGRVLQGFGMGAASPVGRTLMVKAYSRKQLSRLMGLIAGVAAIMPAVAPIAGSFIMELAGWRAVFGFLLLFSTAWIFAARPRLTRIPGIAGRPGNGSEQGITCVFRSILASSRFWGYTIAYASMTGGLLGYYSAMPYWLHVQLGVPRNIFSYLALPTVALYAAGLAFSSFMVRRREVEKLLLTGLALSVLIALTSVLLVLAELSGTILIVVLFSLFGFGAGVVCPNANAGVLTTFREVAAPASSLTALILFGTASLTSMVAMNIQVTESLWPVAFYLVTTTSLGFLSGYFWVWLPFRRSRMESAD